MRIGGISACTFLISRMSNHLSFPMRLPDLFPKVVCCKILCPGQTRTCGHIPSLRASYPKEDREGLFPTHSMWFLAGFISLQVVGQRSLMVPVYEDFSIEFALSEQMNRESRNNGTTTIRMTEATIF